MATKLSAPDEAAHRTNTDEDVTARPVSLFLRADAL